jgi:tetratricopeptide (TPR) repeat protein
MIRTIVVSFLLCLFSHAFAQDSIHQKLFNEDYPSIIFLLGNKEELTSDEVFTLAHSYQQTGQFVQALRVIENHPDKHTKELEKLLSILYFETGNYDAALPILKNWFDQEPKHYANLIRYMEVLDFRKEYPLVAKHLTDYLQYDTLNFDVNKRLAETYQKMDSTSKAIHYYKILFDLYPANQLIGYRLAHLHYKQKEFRECLNICDTLLVSSPNNMRFLNLKGLTYFSADQYKNALIVYRKIEELGDSSFITKKHIGVSHYKLENYPDAIDQLKRAMERKNDDPEVNFFLGASLGQSLHPEDGIMYLFRTQQLIAPSPSLMESIYQKLAGIYYDTKNYKKAIEGYKTAFRYNNKQVQYLYRIASIYDHDINDQELAINYYEQFLMALPDELNPKKGQERYAIQLSEVTKTRIAFLKEEQFFEQGVDTTKSN